MKFESLFKNRVIGKHSPLRFGWSDEQLQPVSEQLRRTLNTSDLIDRRTSGLNQERLMAVASVATSLVVEMKRTGGGLRYARRKDAYRIPKRYHCGDRRFTWHYIMLAMEILERQGLVTCAPGISCVGGGGYQSVAWASEQLVKLLDLVVPESPPREMPTQTETIVLRDESGKDVDYGDTAETMQMRADVATVNDVLEKLDIYCRGAKVRLPLGRRIFNTSFRRGGRFYFHGPSYQNSPAQDRRELTVVIDGSEHPMVEVDYANLHIQMAYAEAGQQPAEGDQYDIHGFNRHLVKIAFNTLLNASSRRSAIEAIAEGLYREDLQQVSLVHLRGREACRRLAARVVDAIEHKHHRIKRYFNSDCGARFQRLDSDMAMQVMLRMIRRTGRCPLPMHDSFLVAKPDVELLAATMLAVARENNLSLSLKCSTGHQWTPIPHTPQQSPTPLPPPLPLP